MSEPFGQTRMEIPAGGAGEARTVLSAARDVELGARSMLLLAEGLFRLDVVPHEDTVQAIFRSLSPDAVAQPRYTQVGGGFESDAARRPPPTGSFGGEIALVEDDGSERPVARFLVGSVCHLDRGLTSFTAQATLLDSHCRDLPP